MPDEVHTAEPSVAAKATLASQINGGGCLPPPDPPLGSQELAHLHSAIMSQVSTGMKYSVRPTIRHNHPVRQPMELDGSGQIDLSLA
eukprot:scaffold168645_cov44-Tisochrysis_lutea.AAC.1